MCVVNLCLLHCCTTVLCNLLTLHSVLQIAQRCLCTQLCELCATGVCVALANQNCKLRGTVCSVGWRREPESNRPTRICKHGTNTLDHRAHLLCTACNFRCAQSLQHCNSAFVKSVRSVAKCTALNLIVQTILTMCVYRTRNIFFTHDEPRNHPCFGAVTQLLPCVQ